MDVNPKSIPVGAIAYYLKDRAHKPTVQFGEVIEHYPSCIVLQLYELKDRRMIGGIPIAEFPSTTRFQKLPKQWTWDTDLIHMEFAPHPEEAKAIRLCVPESIREGISNGCLVRVRDNDHCTLDTEITKDGWRIVKKYVGYVFDRISVPWHEVYPTYDEASESAAKIYEEILRQRSLTDEEWSVEQIDKTLDAWAFANGITDDEKSRVRENIMRLDNIADVEVRHIAGTIQWKYFKNKRWNNIEV